MKPDRMISAYVTLSVNLANINEAFKTWLGNKYPEMYPFVMSEAMKLSCIPVEPKKGVFQA